MFDLIIKNGTVIDGISSKGSKYLADIAVSGNKIKKVGNLNGANAAEVIDAKNMIVAPGFIDIQNHSDVYGTLFYVPNQESMLTQGVTTIIGGNCGASLAPLGYETSAELVKRWATYPDISANWRTMAEFLEESGKRKLGVNFGTLTGHSTIRHSVIKKIGVQASKRELEVMKSLLRTSLEEGSFGLSSGLVYGYARAVETNELIELAKIARDFNAIYSTHLRDEGDTFPRALEEALETCKQSKVSLKISHFKVMHSHNWQEMKTALKVLEKFNDSEFNIHFDVYPYTGTQSALYIILPAWATRHGQKEMLSIIGNKEQRQLIVSEMRKRPYEYEKIIIAQTAADRIFIGKSVSEIAANQNTSPEEAVLNMLIASQGQTACYALALKEENVEMLLGHHLSIIASDGGGYNREFSASGQLVHPRCFGAFPRFLGKYVRDKKILSWERAIHKITGKPAKKLGIHNERGVLQAEKYADITIFDPETITDRATYPNPYQFSEGVKYVIVNGKIALREGKITGEMNGEILRHK